MKVAGSQGLGSPGSGPAALGSQGAGAALKECSAIVVFSGGQDSTICLHWALRTFKSVEAVFFAYGQRHANERVSAVAIAASLGVPLKVFALDLFREMGGNA